MHRIVNNIGKAICVAALVLGVMLWHNAAPQPVQAQAYYGAHTIAAFTPTGQAFIAATTTTANVALPTTANSTPSVSVVVVTNLDAAATVYVKLGTANTVTVTTSNGYPIPPHGVAFLTTLNNTYIAAIGSASANVGISTGF